MGRSQRSRWQGDDPLPIRRPLYQSSDHKVLRRDDFSQRAENGRGHTCPNNLARVATLSAAVRTPISILRIHNGPQAPRLTLLLLTTPQSLKVRANYSVTTCIVQPTPHIGKTAVTIHQQNLLLCSTLCV
jgi:hypothetical protein